MGLVGSMAEKQDGPTKAFPIVGLNQGRHTRGMLSNCEIVQSTKCAWDEPNR
jgi:hypothetical protein